jgi:inner membrane transporter RhtA
LLFVVSAVSQYAGAAIAVRLFALVPAAGLAWLRLAAAAVVMLLWRRPWRTGRRRRTVVVAFGAALAAMNLTYYLAIARLPLGNATAIEFLGPVVVAAAGTRTRRDLGALLLALAGVGLLVEVELSSSPSGLAFALAAAAFWAAYIVLGARVAAGGSGIDDLAVSMVAGTVLLAPIAGPFALPALADPLLAAACLGVGVLSSVIPYALDQSILARMRPARFALLLSLLPATATLTGAVVLRQIPTLPEAAGIGLVVVAVALRSPRG